MQWFNLSFCKEASAGISPNLTLLLRFTDSKQ